MVQALPFLYKPQLSSPVSSNSDTSNQEKNSSQSAQPLLFGVELQERLRQIELWSLFCLVALITSTFRLWLPPGWTSFPQVPAWEFVCRWSHLVDWAGLISLSVSLLAAIIIALTSQIQGSRSPFVDSLRPGLVDRRILEVAAKLNVYRRTALWSILASGCFMIVLNQHRIQAWFLHGLLLCLIFLLSSPQLQWNWLRSVVVSIYIYSAIGKLDSQFIHTVGQDFLKAGATVLNISVVDTSPMDMAILALCLPAVEFALAIGVILKKTRHWAGTLLVLFHLALAGLLYWQMQHSWGVVIWNLQFAVQALILFALPVNVPSSDEHSSPVGPVKSRPPRFSRSYLDRVMAGLLSLMLVMPIFERWGWWDHWPSWALYAPHSSRVQVTVAPYVRDQLPSNLLNVIQGTHRDNNPSFGAVDQELEGNLVGDHLPISQWSLRTLGVPIYPQARFQLGVARHLAEQVGVDLAITAELQRPADRFSGKRHVVRLEGRQALNQYQSHFWLNSRPRTIRQ